MELAVRRRVRRRDDPPSFAERVAHRAGFDRSCIHVHQYAITALVDQIKQIIL
jgi:hypothetical protein